MSYSQIIVFLEGNDDERFFRRIIKHELEKKYSIAIPFKYSYKKDVKINNYLKTIKNLKAIINSIGNARENSIVISIK